MRSTAQHLSHSFLSNTNSKVDDSNRKRKQSSKFKVQSLDVDMQNLKFFDEGSQLEFNQKEVIVEEYDEGSNDERETYK